MKLRERVPKPINENEILARLLLANGLRTLAHWEMNEIIVHTHVEMNGFGSDNVDLLTFYRTKVSHTL